MSGKASLHHAFAARDHRNLKEKVCRLERLRSVGIVGVDLEPLTLCLAVEVAVRREVLARNMMYYGKHYTGFSSRHGTGGRSWGPVQMLLLSTIMLISIFAHYARLCSLKSREICPIMLRKSSKFSKIPRVPRPRAELLALLGISSPSGLQKR